MHARDARDAIEWLRALAINRVACRVDQRAADGEVGMVETARLPVVLEEASNKRCAPQERHALPAKRT